MQKVEGSNPFSRFKKACICRSFSWGSRLVRLLRAGPKPDPRQSRGTFDSKNGTVCREFWIGRTVDLLRRHAEGHEFDPFGESGLARNPPLARAGPIRARSSRCRTRAWGVLRHRLGSGEPRGASVARPLRARCPARAPPLLLPRSGSRANTTLRSRRASMCGRYRRLRSCVLPGRTRADSPARRALRDWG